MRQKITLRTSDHTAYFAQALTWITQGEKVALATVIKTWGSAPRASGSFLIIRQDGLFEGSVSGGCVEGEVITQAQDVIQSGIPKLLSFGVSNARAWEVGLACGGEISILVYCADELALKNALEKTNTGHAVEFNLPHEEAPLLILEPSPRLAIIGAVHIAQFLAPMARAVGYEVLLIDPRAAFLNSERFPDCKTNSDWPDDSLAQWKPNKSCAIVVLTHDPKIDDVALTSALKSEAFYIAALGSRKNHATRCERLQAQGFSESDTTRISGPAGLPIGAASPAEIAVSIMAQMTAIRRGVALT
jgi:xanthine dehydrogenase accessory factor